MKISDIFKKQEVTFSFEFFPPKDKITAVEFGINVGQLIKLNPSFVSVTYGAGGSTHETTFSIVDMFQNKLNLTCMAHYTCVNATKEKVSQDLDQLYSTGIENLMLLRGDPPKGESKFVATSEDFKYGSDLIEFANKQNRFCIGAGAYPEKHIESESLDQDIINLKKKTDAGADFLITQMFFKNKHYFNFVEKARGYGINSRIIPGIIPITNYGQIKRFAELSGSVIPEEIIDNIESYKEDPKKIKRMGIEYAIKQCRELLEKGAPGIHFYTLNQSRAVVEIFEALTWEIKNLKQLKIQW